MKKPHVLVGTRYFTPGYKAGGPIKSLKNLTQALSADINFDVFTSAYDMGEAKPYELSLNQWIRNNLGFKTFYLTQGFVSFFKSLKQLCEKKYDIVYLNSFFDRKFSVCLFFYFKWTTNCRFLIAPRGEFSKGALKIKQKRKLIFLKLVRFFYSDHRVFWHATSQLEADDIRRIFPTAQIEVAENLSFLKPEAFMQGPKISNSVVFFSRISPKKNLTFALQSLKLVNVPLEFHIFGTLEDKVYWAHCQQLIKELPSHIRVTFNGELKPDQVVETLKNYEAFLFPTQGENFGHVIVEALSAGLFCIISDQTPWNDLEAHGIGHSLSLKQPAPFAKAIENYFLKDTASRAQLSKKAVDYIQNKLNTQNSLKQYRSVFSRISQ